MASAAVQYGRTIKPFPTKRLDELLYHVVADAMSVEGELRAILRDPPTLPEDWCQALQRVQGLLWSLEERIQDARPQLDDMHSDAERAYSVAVDAMLAMLRGLQATGEPDPPEAVSATEAAL
jgi:hypothetical protein